MHSIVRSLLLLILPISFTHHLLSMQLEQKTIHLFEEIPEIRNHIIYKFFPRSFSKKDKPKLIHNTIKSMSCVNKEMYRLVHNRETTQTIIDNISEGRNQDYYAKKIATPGMINYLKKSAALYKNIYYKSAQQIDRLINKGADINYFPRWQCPLLFKTLYNYNKTRDLLERGANPNVVYHGKTAIQLMIEKNYFFMTKLFLSHNPYNKCLPIAVFFQNPRIIHCILQQKNIPLSELNESLGVALQKSDTIIIKALIDAGAQLDTVLTDIKEKLTNISLESIFNFFIALAEIHAL